MSDTSLARACLRCGGSLKRSDDSRADIAFFECQACGRRYSEEGDTGLMFRWPHPIGIALYGYLFRSGIEEHHLSTVVRSLAGERTPEEIASIVQEIELELEQPTQQVHRMLGGMQHSEMECREFLQAVLGRLREELRIP